MGLSRGNSFDNNRVKKRAWFSAIVSPILSDNTVEKLNLFAESNSKEQVCNIAQFSLLKSFDKMN